MPTLKQRSAYKKAVENHGNISRAMREVGYDASTAKNPKNLTESKGWKELLKEYLPDADLTKRHKEQLDSSKHQKLYFDLDDEDEKIESVCKELGVKLLYVKENKDKTGKTAHVKAPDFFYRDLALDKAYKIKGRYDGENSGGNKTLIINITSETAERYGLLPNQSPSTDSSR